MDSLWKDIRYALHALRSNPGFALISILTLALGIGATTAIFSVVNGVLLQPLPFADPSRLVMVWERSPDEGADERNVVSGPNFTAWEAEVPRTFSSMGTIVDWQMSLTGQAEPELVLAGLSSGRLFTTLGARPFLGRVFNEGDASEEGENSIVLSHVFWQRKFGGDPGAVGRTVSIDNTAHTVIGVMPREFFVPESQADLWVPYAINRTSTGRYLKVVARLAPGVSVEQAQARLDVVARQTQEAAPENNKDWGVLLVPLHEQVVGSVRRALLIVMAAVALLLLIACVNVANLQLSRASSRSKEMAVRAALGASRGRLIRQLLSESAVLALIAGVVGVLLAGWATMLLVSFMPDSAMMPRTAEITVDGRVLAASAVLTLFVGILFGLAPAIEASRTDLQTGLKSTGRGSSQDRRGRTFRNGLVVAEVALATVLLIGAGLLIKSFSKLEAVESGVRPENALTMRIVLTDAHATAERRGPALREILDRVRQVPGVERVGAIPSLNLPFSGSWSRDSFTIEGAPPPPMGEEPGSDIRPIAGDYFGAMGIPLLSGRMLDYRATAPDRTEVVVNEALARRHFPGGQAVGRRIKFEWNTDHSAEIVGVVGNVRAKGLDADPATAMYFSFEHDARRQFALIIRTSGDPAAVQVPVTKVLHSFDPQMPVSHVLPLDELISGTIARPRFNATMLSLFAALGLLLASIGIYGVLSYSVSQRKQDMGIRMALGADPSDVLRLVVRDGMAVALFGVAVGVVIAVAATRLLSALLHGVEPSDPVVFVTVAVALTAVALGASYIPARRATQVDPMIALRPE